MHTRHIQRAPLPNVVALIGHALGATRFAWHKGPLRVARADTQRQPDLTPPSLVLAAGLETEEAKGLARHQGLCDMLGACPCAECPRVSLSEVGRSGAACRHRARSPGGEEVMWLYSTGHTETRAIVTLERCVR